MNAPLRVPTTGRLSGASHKDIQELSVRLLQIVEKGL
jgi:hypothetical protein